MSNRLIDILDDEDKLNNMHSNYQYTQNTIPRLEKLRKAVYKQHNANKDKGFHENLMTANNDKEDLKFIWNLIDDLKDNPQHRLTPVEMKKCNGLWKKHGEKASVK